MLSIKGMKKNNWTIKQVVKEALHRLDKQGLPAANVIGTCMYLNPVTGSKCAIGILLSKKDLKELERYDGMAVNSVPAVVSKELAQAIEFYNYESTLTELQEFHDNAVTADTFEAEDYLGLLGCVKREYLSRLYKKLCLAQARVRKRAKA